jgi:hypothetical protein
MKHKILAILLITPTVSQAEYLIKFNDSYSKNLIPNASEQTLFHSCKEILDNGQSGAKNSTPIL